VWGIIQTVAFMFDFGEVGIYSVDPCYEEEENEGEYYIYGGFAYQGKTRNITKEEVNEKNDAILSAIETILNMNI